MNPVFARVNMVFWAAAMAASLAAPAQADYVAFDPPTSRFTMPLHINGMGAIVGYWFDGNLYHGFLREPDGTITNFDPPNSVETTPLDINDKGVIVGTYMEVKNNISLYHGFIRLPNGTIASYDAPGSAGYSVIRAVNQKRTIAGYYTDDKQRSHGFVQDAAGNFASFDPPNSLETYAWDINDSGTITGYYDYAGDTACGNLVFGGMSRAPDGKITTFDVGAGVNPKQINSHNVIAGQYVDDACHVDGFVRQADGNVETFDYPGNFCCTYVEAVNKQGSVVGWFYDSQENVHGYRRTKTGKFTMIQPDGHPKTNSEALGINADGQITGWYTDRAGLHGFLYAP